MSIKGFKIGDNIEKVDYESLENKPFYSAEEFPKEVVSLQDIELVQSEEYEQLLMASCMNIFKTPILANRTYNIAFDGVSEKGVCKLFDDDESIIPYFGNVGLLFGEDFDTGEPYIVLPASYETLILYKSSDIAEGTHTFSITYADVDYDMIVVADSVYSVGFDSKDGRPETIEAISPGYIPSLNNKFIFTLNGNSYDVELKKWQKSDNAYYAGNLSLVERTSEDTGEDFCLIFSRDSIELYVPEEGEYTVYLALLPEEIIHKMDNKYLNIPCEVDRNGNVIFENDVTSKNIDELTEDLTEFKETYSDKLYEHFGIDRTECPYIVITSTLGTRTLYFLKNNNFVYHVEGYKVTPSDSYYPKESISSIIEFFLNTTSTPVSTNGDNPATTLVKYYYANFISNFSYPGKDTSVFVTFDVSDSMRDEIYRCGESVAKLICDLDNVMDVVNSGKDAIILKSSTEGSSKKFKITVDDSGNLTATEITE